MKGIFGNVKVKIILIFFSNKIIKLKKLSGEINERISCEQFTMKCFSNVFHGIYDFIKKERISGSGKFNWKDDKGIVWECDGNFFNLIYDQIKTIKLRNNKRQNFFGKFCYEIFNNWPSLEGWIFFY